MEVCWGGTKDTWGGVAADETRQVRGSGHEGPLVHVEDDLHCLGIGVEGQEWGRKEATIQRLLPSPR